MTVTTKRAQLLGALLTVLMMLGCGKPQAPNAGPEFRHILVLFETQDADQSFYVIEHVPTGTCWLRPDSVSHSTALAPPEFCEYARRRAKELAK